MSEYMVRVKELSNPKHSFEGVSERWFMAEIIRSLALVAHDESKDVVRISYLCLVVERYKE